MNAKDYTPGKPVIDLRGPDGNAYALAGHAHRFAKQLGLDHKAITDEMFSSKSYEELLGVFEKYFGEYVVLIR